MDLPAYDRVFSNRAYNNQSLDFVKREYVKQLILSF
jgi:tRNA U34 5-carboxymethylaminomethyl modifying GTPase MnmE/TrmE